MSGAPSLSSPGGPAGSKAMQEAEQVRPEAAHHLLTDIARPHLHRPHCHRTWRGPAGSWRRCWTDDPQTLWGRHHPVSVRLPERNGKSACHALAGPCSCCNAAPDAMACRRCTTQHSPAPLKMQQTGPSAAQSWRTAKATDSSHTAARSLSTATPAHSQATAAPWLPTWGGASAGELHQFAPPSYPLTSIVKH